MVLAARCGLTMALLFAAAPVSAYRLQLAQLNDKVATLSEVQSSGEQTSQPLPDELRTPLGSLWKLYVRAYQLDQRLADPGYQCSGQNPEEVYCCEPGERIDGDQALVRSCGLYFEPARLGIQSVDWQRYWQARSAPAWLNRLEQLQPGTEVPVTDILQTLHRLPAQTELRRILLDVLVQARDPNVIGELAGQMRVKTWSWRRRAAPYERRGGFAGWLVDGTPVWASGDGGSQTVLSRFAPALGRSWSPRISADTGECVDVSLFERYPVRAVEKTGKPVASGRLTGEFQVLFDNGQKLDVHSQGELLLSRHHGKLQLSARLSREEYVARVLDREAAAEPAAAARALAITIRSYLQQNATRAGNCLSIADSSALQRVAPRPASAAARAIAASTSDLLLSGSPVSYHLDLAGEARLSWSAAVEQARAGARYDQILRRAFPNASLGRWDRPQTGCTQLPAAADWLRARLPGWRPILDAEPGYAETREFEVCRLQAGRPHVDRERRRIHVRALSSLQDRLDLTHEYLHLAFAAHPLGQDEAFVEALTRRLLLE